MLACIMLIYLDMLVSVVFLSVGFYNEWLVLN